jgi:hypothetical protein
MRVLKTFKTPSKTFWGEVIVMLVLVAVGGPFLFLIFAFVPVLMLEQNNVIQPRTGLVLKVFLCLFVFSILWRVAMNSLRFRIELYDDSFAVGRGPARKTLSYAVVDVIIAKKKDNVSWIVIKAPGLRTHVYLADVDVERCGQALQQRCKNAVYIDPSGMEFLPPESNRPLQNLLFVQRRSFLWFVFFALAAPTLTVVTVLLLAGMYNSGGLAMRGGVTIFSLPAVTLACGAAAVSFFRKWRDAKAARTLMIEQGVTDSTVSNSNLRP